MIEISSEGSIPLEEIKRHRSALSAIARGLEHDTDGRFRTVLLAKQQQVMNAVTDRQTAQQHRENQRHTVFSASR